jgi:hypothetical protein
MRISVHALHVAAPETPEPKMSYTTAAARTNIVAVLRATPYAMRVAELAAAAYRRFADANGSDAAALAFVQHGERQVRRYVRIGYAAIADLKRSGTIVSATTGRVRLARAAAPAATTSTPAPAPVAAPAPAAPTFTPVNGNVRAQFDAFVAALGGDAGAWTQAYAIGEAEQQVAALRTLRAFIEDASAILAEEGFTV